MNPITISQELIRCPSITPQNDGALEVVEKYLSQLGFTCERHDFEGIVNLYAYKGSGHPHLCFAGHTDVVPLGESKLWTYDPFQGIIDKGLLWGRGACDMKCAIACFITAVSAYLDKNPLHGKISFLITGDEEKDAVHGTQCVLPILAERKDIPDLCLIGEPTALKTVGDTLKIGRRGSITGSLTCYGKQGHIAYPQYTDNPIPRLLDTLQALYHHRFDEGTDVFEPTHLEITSIDVGNTASNIIPHKADARFGVRINSLQNGKDLCQTITSLCEKSAGKHELSLTVHGEAYLTKEQHWITLVQQAVQDVTGQAPAINTTGATTDGRFISAHCPVIECGMKEATMHQIDEHVAVEDIEKLTSLYLSILTSFYLPANAPSAREEA